jgi:hypothetical protein
MTKISNVSNLLLGATTGIATALVFQSAPASAASIAFGTTTVDAVNSANTFSFTVNSDYAADDQIVLNAEGLVNLSSNNSYVTNAAGVLAQAAPTYGLAAGDSSLAPNSINYGALLIGNDTLGFFNVFPNTTVANPSFSGTLASVFGSGLTNGTQIFFKVNDTDYLDNTGSFAVSGSINSTVVPEPFTIVGTLVGGTAAVRMRKKLKAAIK